MRIRRRKPDLGEVRPYNVLWGVPRREGHSDTDDPLAHHGLVQHAFVMGNDARALCGFAPPKRSSRADRTPRPQLALPGQSNPPCRKCVALLEAAASRVEVAQHPAEAQPAHPAPHDTPAAPPMPRSSRAWPVGSTPRSTTWTPRAEPDPSAPGEEEIDEIVVSHPSARVRRGGLVTVPAGRQSVVAELPESARGAAVAAQVDGDYGSVRVKAVALRDDGRLHITLNESTSEPVEVVWFVI